ncbi:MAG: hypothetical protein GXO78_07065 [Calditrichaeota bacterium]|nr:hypothetical protein [Calditrichota bacterium]
MKWKLDSPRARVPLLILALFSLLLGLISALQRLGYDIPLPHPSLPALHGPLMVTAFLGALISLERAVARKTSLAYSAPILSALGIGFTLAFPNQLYGPLLFTISAFLLSLLLIRVFLQYSEIHFMIMSAGALSWFIGNLWWGAGKFLFQVVPWWMGFLLLTIVAERLELSRIFPPRPLARIWFLVSNGVLILAMTLTNYFYVPGLRLMGLSLLALTGWLFLNDVARHTVTTSGLPKFTAWSLLSGYAWLAVTGWLALLAPVQQAGFYYDAFLHTFFVGFVFSMIFGHAPIIFPAILDLKIHFHNRFYFHLILLHIGLLVRTISDLIYWMPGKQIGGVLNVLAILLFLINNARSILQAKKSTSG